MRWRLGNGRAAVVAVGAIVLAAAVALAYWPALRAFLDTDDYTLLAFARILRDPLAPFVHEHFPLGPYFRPLAMLLWWTSARLFGNALAPQYALNLLLHVGVALALWRLLARIAGGSSPGAWLVAFLFAVHPAAIGTALWLSDRFDLLATLFAMLALDAALAARAGAAAGAPVACVFVVCALLSKETGIAVAAAVVAAWSWPRGDGSRLRPVRPVAAAVVVAMMLAWIAWRARSIPAVLGTMVGPAATPVAWLGGGSLRWLADLGLYAAAWQRMAPGSRAAWAVALVLLIAAAAMLLRNRCACTEVRNDTATAALVSTLVAIATCIVIEAPYAYLWSVSPASADAPSIAKYSRLFYLPLCAVAIAAVSAMVALRNRGTGRPAPVALAATAALLLAFAWLPAAHRLAREYRRETNVARPLTMALLDAIGRAPLPAGRCRVFVLGVAVGDAGYMLAAMPDAVVKALAVDERKVEHCLIQTNRASWENIVGGESVTRESAAPLSPMSGAGGPYPWLDVGGVQVVYLNLFADIDARSLAPAVFFRRRGDHFEDVTDAVRSGAVDVRFECARAAAQCRR